MTAIAWVVAAVFALLAFSGWASAIILASTVVKITRRAVFWRDLARRWGALYGEKEKRTEASPPDWKHGDINIVDPRMN